MEVQGNGREPKPLDQWGFFLGCVLAAVLVWIFLTSDERAYTRGVRAGGGIGVKISSAPLRNPSVINELVRERVAFVAHDGRPIIENDTAAFYQGCSRNGVLYNIIVLKKDMAVTLDPLPLMAPKGDGLALAEEGFVSCTAKSPQ